MSLGVYSHWHWRFPVALGLHALACVLLAETGARAPFAWSQFLFSALIAFVIVTTLCWQWRLFGDPRRPANALLHVAFFFSAMFFVNRLFQRSDHASATDRAADLAEGAVRTLVGWIPPVVFDVLHSPGAAVLFLGVALALSLRRRPAIGLLAFVLLLAVVLSVTGPDFGDVGWFVAGLLALGGALLLQRDDPVRRRFWTLVTRRFRGDPALRADLELKTRLLMRLEELRRPVTERECMGVVSRALGMEASSPQTATIARRIVQALVEQDHLAVIIQNQSGSGLALNAEVFIEASDDAFAYVAAVPKALVVLFIALLWVISPVDALPDFMPVLGVLDDVVVGVLGVGAFFQTLSQHRLGAVPATRGLFARGARERET